MADHKYQTGPGNIADQEFYRQAIPEASEYVRVRREDLEILRHYKTTTVLGGPSPKEAEAIKRIDAALETPWPDQ
jgi:hypothetical protein